MTGPVVTVAVPSFNQGRFLGENLASIFQQDISVEVFVLDGGSTDGSLDVIKRWEHRLAGWRSRSDSGQAAAINEGIASGTAPYVAWLNSDDCYEPNGLTRLVEALEGAEDSPAVYGRAWDLSDRSGKRRPAWVEPFSAQRLAQRCFVSQPATLMRRSVWLALGGVDEHLSMALDYDLWWRIYREYGPLAFVDAFAATNRIHDRTKTNSYRAAHYREAIGVVRTHYGRVPLKWYAAQPYKVWWKATKNYLATLRAR